MIIFIKKKLETNNFAISVLLSTKLINFFMLFMSFAPSAYWRSHQYILSPSRKNIHDELLVVMTPESQQLINGAMEKGASSWLSALPIKAIGYALNKQEFTDAIWICMRYGWKVKGIPTHCACGETNSVDHSLIRKLGGYTSMRHKSVRNSKAQIMREVCRDVQTEPKLLPINENDYQRKESQHCWQCKVGYLREKTVE